MLYLGWRKIKEVLIKFGKICLGLYGLCDLCKNINHGHLTCPL